MRLTKEQKVQHMTELAAYKRKGRYSGVGGGKKGRVTMDEVFNIIFILDS